MPQEPLRRCERLQTEAVVWVISDLHLGDGTGNDAFFGKDAHLLAFLDHVERTDGTLIVNGDALDFHQAFGFARILKAHGDILTTLSRLGRAGRLLYVVGNHDHDVTVFADILAFRVCQEVVINDRILVRHGHEYDPYILGQIEEGQWHTLLHHLVERWLGTWIRIPLSEFYTWPNRVLFWLGHKVGAMADVAGRLGRWLGEEGWGEEVRSRLDLWAWSNLGDSMGIFRPAFQDALHGPWDAVVCGHSHVPGVVRRDGRCYANSGSWTFAATQYLRIDGDGIRAFDFASGREYRDELYQNMLDGSLYERDFAQWWRESYMGFLRYREGEIRNGRPHAWEAWQRDAAPPELGMNNAPPEPPR
ncbi:MAG: hypothetical protein RLZZ383_2088 [Pseudomonadota bacterium]